MDTIAVLATHATDIFIDESRKSLLRRDGGPAFFISNFLKKSKIFYHEINPPHMFVEIMVTSDGEIGRVKDVGPQFFVDFSKINSDFLIISSIINEISLEGIGAFSGKIFLDAQGFVRGAHKFGAKKIWNEAAVILPHVFGLKCTEEELLYIPAKAIEDQKNRILIVTCADKGCTLFMRGNKIEIQLEPGMIVHCAHAVGAGDTFLAAFTSHFFQTQDAVDSIKFAQKAVFDFLSLI